MPNDLTSNGSGNGWNVPNFLPNLAVSNATYKLRLLQSHDTSNTERVKAGTNFLWVIWSATESLANATPLDSITRLEESVDCQICYVSQQTALQDRPTQREQSQMCCFGLFSTTGHPVDRAFYKVCSTHVIYMGSWWPGDQGQLPVWLEGRGFESYCFTWWMG